MTSRATTSKMALIAQRSLLFRPFFSEPRGTPRTGRLGRVQVFLTFTSYVVAWNGRTRAAVTRPLDPAGTWARPYLCHLVRQMRVVNPTFCPGLRRAITPSCAPLLELPASRAACRSVSPLVRGSG